MVNWVLTGASRGLGLEFERQLSSTSSNTIFADIRSFSTEHSDLQSLVTSSPAKIHIYECNSSSRDSILTFAYKDFPPPSAPSGHIDSLLNNAGINTNPSVPVLGSPSTVPTSTGEPSTLPRHLQSQKKWLNSHISINVLAPPILATALGSPI